MLEPETHAGVDVEVEGADGDGADEGGDEGQDDNEGPPLRRQFMPAFKRQWVDEALKGERGVTEIATEGGFADARLYEWLRQHYEQNPHDSRRHLVLRRSTAPEAREDMPRKKKARAPVTQKPALMGPNSGENNPQSFDAATRDKALALMRAGEKTMAAIAEEVGVNAATLSHWRIQYGLRAPTADEKATLRKAMALMAEGKLTKAQIAEKVGWGSQTLNNWLHYAAAKAASRRETLSEARALHTENMRTDPEYRDSVRSRMSEGRRLARETREAEQRAASSITVSDDGEEQQRLTFSSVETRTVSSNGNGYHPESAVPRRPLTSDEASIAEALKTALEERSALRGMVDILQRENEALKRQTRRG